MNARDVVEDSVKKYLCRACATQYSIFPSLGICLDCRIKGSFQVPWGTESVETWKWVCVEWVWGDFQGRWTKAGVNLWRDGQHQWQRLWCEKILHNRRSTGCLVTKGLFDWPLFTFQAYRRKDWKCWKRNKYCHCQLWVTKCFLSNNSKSSMIGFSKIPWVF